MYLSFRLLISLCLGALPTMAQTAVDALENALAGVVTVAVFQDGSTGRRVLGSRGDDIAAMAYAQTLSLSGAHSSGSGFIIESGGKKYVITNAHVVESAADASGSLAVFSVNRKKYEVTVVGGDALYDFAVLSFVTPPGPELTALAFRTQPARIGERVYAIGNPQGEYPYTVTDGIISAKNRVRGGLTGKFGFLQTTATVIWGNSGGPLVDERGQVLGINSQIAFADGPGGQPLWLSQINFALETPVATRLLNDVLTNDGLVRRAYLGLEFSQTSQATDDQKTADQATQGQQSANPAHPNKAPAQPADGTSAQRLSAPILSAILPDSPAKALLASAIGQTIKAVNGEEVRSLEEVLGALENVRPGASVNLTFSNGTADNTVTIKTGTLTPVQLEGIARFVLSSSRLTLADSPSGITLRFNDTNNTYEVGPQQKFRKVTSGGLGEKSTGTTETAASNYLLVAAGLQAEGGSKFWHTQTLSYLGAVCRLMGLAGVIDLGIMQAGGNARLVRQQLSGQEGRN